MQDIDLGQFEVDFSSDASPFLVMLMTAYPATLSLATNQWQIDIWENLTDDG